MRCSEASALPSCWLWLLLFTPVLASLNPFASKLHGMSDSCVSAARPYENEHCKALGHILTLSDSSTNQRKMIKAWENLDVCLKALEETRKNITRECTLPSDVLKYDGLILPATSIADSHISMYKLKCQEASALLLPDAPGTVRYCAKYRHYVSKPTQLEGFGKRMYMDKKTANSCWWIISEEGISPEELLEWNPSLDSGLARCELRPGVKYCVKKRTFWLKSIFSWLWSIYNFVTFCRSVLRIFGWG